MGEEEGVLPLLFPGFTSCCSSVLRVLCGKAVLKGLTPFLGRGSWRRAASSSSRPSRRREVVSGAQDKLCTRAVDIHA